MLNLFLSSTITPTTATWEIKISHILSYQCRLFLSSVPVATTSKRWWWWLRLGLVYATRDWVHTRIPLPHAESSPDNSGGWVLVVVAAAREEEYSSEEKQGESSPISQKTDSVRIFPFWRTAAMWRKSLCVWRESTISTLLLITQEEGKGTGGEAESEEGQEDNTKEVQEKENQKKKKGRQQLSWCRWKLVTVVTFWLGGGEWCNVFPLLWHSHCPK